MATVDTANRQSTLPPISHLDLDKIKTDHGDASRFSGMNGINLSTAPLASPNTLYSGPPPPYSFAQPTNNSSQPHSGYISPPESTTRRSTREEKESPVGRTSLPSIHEALADKGLPFSAPLSATVPPPPGSTPSTAITHSYPEAPKGPSNPFSQPPPPSFRDNPFQPSSQTQSQEPPKPVFQTSATVEPPPAPPSQSFSHVGSPRSSNHTNFRPAPVSNSTFGKHVETTHRSPPPLHVEPSRSSFSFPEPSAPSSGFSSEPYRFTAGSKFQEQPTTFARPPDPSYGDTVKRHLDVFDAELGLSEIAEASSRTLDFSRVWAQRHHQSNRAGYYQDSLPSVQEIEDVMRQSHRVLDNLNHLREIVIAQQQALANHRARLAHGNHLEDEYGGLSDDFKGGGFAGGDAKKRRGKAAPPGRCHSCNRAETPEWRRGPDGARTLCNACGLHYAKLTRKMGVKGAAALTGSQIRPKNMDQRP